MIKRCENNPIITIKDVKPSRPDFHIIGVFNPGVIKYKDETILLLRVAEQYNSTEDFVGVPKFNPLTKEMEILKFYKNDVTCDFSDCRFVKQGEDLYITSISHIRLARSKDGVHFEIDEHPFISASDYYDCFGVEDPRVTKIGSWYYINFSTTFDKGVCTALARTKDFKTVERLGIIFLPDNKDIIIFPKKIGGKYQLFCRPTSAYFGKPEIWSCKSKDLKYFGEYKHIIGPQPGCFDDFRVGSSCVPFLTEKGWVEIYHGATRKDRYCLGAMLLDSKDPTKVLARTKKPLLEPEGLELDGFMPNVLFACGCHFDGKTVHLYYGANDEKVCYATIEIDDIYEALGL